MKSKTMLSYLVIFVTVGAALFGGWVFLASYPKLDIRMYHTEESLVSTTNVPVLIETMGSQFGESQICFQVQNIADKNSNTDVIANNLIVSVQTDTDCAKCNIGETVGTLEAQASTQVCKRVKSPNTEQIFFKVIPNYDALMLHWNPVTEFNCKLIKTEQTKNHYTCNLTHKDFLGLNIFGIRIS